MVYMKTSHRGFPKTALQHFLAGEANQSQLTVCILGEATMRRTRIKMMATGHRGPARVPLCLVSSYFTTQPVSTMKYMIKHPSDTTHLLAKEIQ
eukprot:scaffold162_cov486-Pavlova_lutheri.AAC.1